MKGQAWWTWCWKPETTECQGRAARATVHVQLQDQKRPCPELTLPHYRVAVTEDLPPGSTLLTLEATDADGAAATPP